MIPAPFFLFRRPVVPRLRPWFALSFLLGLGAISPQAAAAQEGGGAVDLALVLALDTSSSVDWGEFDLEARGLALALKDPEVLAAIAAGPNHAIAICILQWASGGEGNQQLAIGWRRIDGQAAAEALSEEVLEMPRLIDAGGTSINGALTFAGAQFQSLPWPASRHTIDVSGDGRSNDGRDVEGPREALVASGVSINGLAIVNEEPDLESYYREAVIGGPSAFVIVANDYKAYKDAMQRKLALEIGASALIVDATPVRPPAPVRRPG